MLKVYFKLSFFIFFSILLSNDDNNVDYFLATDNDFLDHLRVNCKNPKILNEEINLYKEKYTNFLNFFENKNQIDNDNLIKEKISLIKENLLNEKTAEIQSSIKNVFKDFIISNETNDQLINESLINLNNSELLEKQKIIQNLIDSNKIDKIQELVKKYKKIDEQTVKKIEIFSKSQKEKKNSKINIIFNKFDFLFKGLFLYSNLCIFFGKYFRSGIKNMKLNEPELEEIKKNDDLFQTISKLLQQKLIETQNEPKIEFNQKNSWEKIKYLTDNFKEGIKTEEDRMPAIFINTLLFLNKSLYYVTGSEKSNRYSKIYFSLYILKKFYNIYQNIKYINFYKKTLLDSFNEKIKISNEIRKLILESNKNEEIKLKEFIKNDFLNKKIENKKIEIQNVFKINSFNKGFKNKIKSIFKINFSKKIFFENKKDEILKITGFNYEKNTFQKNDLIYFTDKFVNFSDSLCARALLKKNNLNFSYPVLIENSKIPILKIENMFSPEYKNPIKNNVDLKDEGEKNKNMLITGPTGSGKTNYLREIIKTLKYANLGLVPAEKMEYTNFKYIYNNVNQKEILEASKHETENANVLDFKKKLNKNEFKLFLIDEIFCGTTEEQAYIGALNKLTPFMKDDKVVFIGTTHFEKHLKLCDDQKNKIYPYFVLVENKNQNKEDFILRFKILSQNKQNQDKNWWFRKDLESEEKRRFYAIWKEKIEEEKLKKSLN